MWASEREKSEPPRPATDATRSAWIGKSVIVKGDVIASEDLTIDGRVEGTIEVGAHGLTIGVGAAVLADLVARVITISGSVTGNVTATERVDLRATGSVDGDVTTPRLAMDEGAVLHGEVATVERVGSCACSGYPGSHEWRRPPVWPARRHRESGQIPSCRASGGTSQRRSRRAAATRHTSRWCRAGCNHGFGVQGSVGAAAARVACGPAPGCRFFRRRRRRRPSRAAGDTSPHDAQRGGEHAPSPYRLPDGKYSEFVY